MCTNSIEFPPWKNELDSPAHLSVKRGFYSNENSTKTLAFEIGDAWAHFNRSSKDCDKQRDDTVYVTVWSFFRFTYRATSQFGTHDGDGALSTLFQRHDTIKWHSIVQWLGLSSNLIRGRSGPRKGQLLGGRGDTDLGGLPWICR